MALPKPLRPEYTTTIPSTGKRIKYQPFTVKEEKVLVLAAEGGDPDEITNAVSNVLSNCITTAGVEVDELALFDVEYLFLKCRAKSVGEKIELQVQDPNDPDFVTEHSVDVDKIKIEESKNHNPLIDLGDNMMIKMKYPDIHFFSSGINLQGINNQFDIIAKCVSQIVSGEEVYQATDMGAGEIEEWLESLTSSQFTKILEFFATMPKLSHSITKKNTNTGENFTIVLEGLADFF